MCAALFLLLDQKKPLSECVKVHIAFSFKHSMTHQAQDRMRVCSTLERKTREIAEDSVDTAIALTPFNLAKNIICVFQ